MSNNFVTENLLRSFGIRPTYINDRCIPTSYRMHARRSCRLSFHPLHWPQWFQSKKPDSNAVLRFYMCEIHTGRNVLLLPNSHLITICLFWFEMIFTMEPLKPLWNGWVRKKIIEAIVIPTKEIRNPKYFRSKIPLTINVYSMEYHDL